MNHEDVKSRNDLPALIDSMGLKTGVELGVWRGENSEFLLTHSSLSKLWSIDAWCDDTEVVKATFKKDKIKDGAIEKYYQETLEKLKKYGERSGVLRGISWEQAKKFDDGSLDFVYVDASHRYSGVSYDLLAWWPKVRMGGLFAGHDYMYKYRYEVMEAVNGFLCEEQQILHITTDDMRPDGSACAPPTWWCVKEDIGRFEWANRIKAAMPGLLKQREILRKKGTVIVLPYQYYELTGMVTP